MRFPDLLTPAERRLAVLLFVLSAIGSAVRVGERLSPEVRAWLDAGEEPVPEFAPPLRPTPPPAPGDLAPPSPDPGPPRVPAPARGPATEGPLDLNRADRAALQALPGVGPVLAERILENRRQNGPFLSVEDLRRVKGIGEKTLERLRPLVSVP